MSLNRPTRISGVAASRLNPLAGPPRNRRGSGNASLVSAAKLKLRELSLELPSPFSTDALCALISKRRVRPIMIHEVDHLPFDGPCGLWVACNDSLDPGIAEELEHLQVARDLLALVIVEEVARVDVEEFCQGFEMFLGGVVPLPLAQHPNVGARDFAVVRRLGQRGRDLLVAVRRAVGAPHHLE